MEGWQIALLVIAILLIIAILLLLSIAPRKRRKTLEPFTSPTRYAHRGLHDEEKAENSLSAFRAAVERGYGIEFDVRATKDGTIVVFHDPTLERMTGEKGKVIDKTYEELKSLRLANTQDGIPTFAELLRLVDGKIPLLVEIKQDVSAKDVDKIIEMLRAYKGSFVIESFNPLSIGRVRKAMPEVGRGVLSMSFCKEKQFRTPLHWALQNLLLDFYARPDFLAYEKKGWNNLSLRLCKKWFSAYSFAWTIQSPEEEKVAFEHGYDAVIFENYIPKED